MKNFSKIENIIPELKKYLSRDGTFLIGEKCKIYSHPENKYAVAKLKNYLKDKIQLEWIKTDGAGNTLIIAENQGRHNCRSLKANHYKVKVSEKSILMEGASQESLFHAVTTLCRLMDGKTEIQFCEIEDYPSIPLRCLHWDLKGMMPRFDYLKKLLVSLADYKINSVLIEYEDKIKYKKHGGIASKNALSTGQIKELNRIAEENFIQLIPLVQSLGHVEYVLKNRKYSQLAENNESPQQYCPSNKEAFAHVKELLSEIIPLHNSPYVHIGGDETRQLGSCETCRKYAKRNGKLELYAHYIRKVCDFVISKGKIPIIWDDMLCRSFRLDLLKKLPEETIVMPWAYNIRDTKEVSFIAPGEKERLRIYSSSWLRRNYKNPEKQNAFMEALMFNPSNLGKGGISHYETMNAKVKKKIRKYVETEFSPQYFNPVPTIPLIMASGHDFIGACALQESGDGKFNIDIVKSFENINAWGRIIKKYSGLGILGTAWSRSDSFSAPGIPMEARWYQMIAFAENAWTGGKTGIEKLDRKFNLSFLGLETNKVTDLLIFNQRFLKNSYSSYIRKELENVLPLVRKNRNAVKAIYTSTVLAELAFHFDLFTSRYNDYYYQIAQNKIPAMKKKMLLKNISLIKELAVAARHEINEELKRYIVKDDMHEYINCIFMPIENSINAAKTKLNSCGVYLRQCPG